MACRYFKNARYVKAAQTFNKQFSFDDPAPLFRKKFTAGKFKKAKIAVQGLGIAYFYLNGQLITEDKFLSPWSDYRKILWYNVYDVSEMLREGENTIAVICGNGFYNESFETPWGHSVAKWRDVPKFILELKADGETLVSSDDSWVCSTDSFITFNQLRSGERFDARKYNPKWTENDFDDSEFYPVIVDDNPPEGKFVLYKAQPVREKETFYPQRIFRNKNGYVVDFGQNLSGYVQLTIRQNAGDKIVIRHTEEIDSEGNVKLNYLCNLYPQVPFQTDEIICSGQVDVYKPTFTFHGFRYVEIEGIRGELKKEDVKSIFLRQDVKRRSEFKTENPVLQFIYDGGIKSTYSNLFYVLTDCPTREKLGWANDAQASCEQILYNFDCVRFYEKWYADVLSSMREDGALPAVFPSPDWGFDWGPVCDLLLYEIPLRVYEYTGKSDLLKKGLPYFYRYLAYFEKMLDCGYKFLLADWMGDGNSKLTPDEFVWKMYLLKALQTINVAEKIINGAESETISDKILNVRKSIISEYICQDGKSRINEQTVLALLICFGFSDERKILEKQLVEVVIKDEFKVTCGMVGVQYLYDALALCGKTDIALKLITESDPGYRTWFNHGATTLWEVMDAKNLGFSCVDFGSHNHHMFSGVIAWFFRRLLGFEPDIRYSGFEKINLNPNFVSGTGFLKCSFKTVRGVVKISVREKKDRFIYEVSIPETITATYKNKTLVTGKNVFTYKKEK